MKIDNLEAILRTVYKHGDRGNAKSLHAAKPRISNKISAIEILRSIIGRNAK